MVFIALFAPSAIMAFRAFNIATGELFTFNSESACSGA